MKNVTVYYRPSCAFSMGAINFLLLRGADFKVVNLVEHPDVEGRVNAALGDRKLETPTFEVDGRFLVAPSNSDLKDLLPDWNLEPEAAPYEKVHHGAD